jgi:hypothetical protein
VRTFTQVLERPSRASRASLLVLRSLRSDKLHVADTLFRLTEQQENALATALTGALCTACGTAIGDSSDAHLTVWVERMPPLSAAVLCGICADDLLTRRSSYMP